MIERTVRSDGSFVDVQVDKVNDDADEADRSTLRQQVASRLPKARAIIADPVNAPDWTAAERKTILALDVIDLARRHR